MEDFFLAILFSWLISFISLFTNYLFCNTDDIINDVCGNDIVSLSLKLNYGISIDYKDLQVDISILHYAVLSNNLDMVSFLINRGSNVNITNNNGDTPLHRASSFGYYDIVNILLQAGANINCQNLQGLTPLMYAIIEEKLSIIDLLINFVGINLNICDIDGYAALHYAVMSDSSIEICKKLLQFN